MVGMKLKNKDVMMDRHTETRCISRQTKSFEKGVLLLIVNVHPCHHITGQSSKD